MKYLFSMQDTKPRIFVLFALTAVGALFHYLIPTSPHSYHVIHIILRKFYFLPPVIAAAWFGLRGATLTTLAISVLFSLHAFIDWPGNYMEQANQVGELAGFWAVGLIPGYLFDRQRSLLMRLADANEETILALVSSLDLREHNTRLHSQRVREYTLLLADKYGISVDQKKILGLGALLHDVGKIAVSDQILLKPAKLSEDEWKEMRKHPVEGYRLLSAIGSLREAAEIVHAHHEHFDGSGYPLGLKGEEIPWGARLFAVADAYDALTTPRPYHLPITHSEAIKLIEAGSGTHFDPEVVQIFKSTQVEEFKAISGQYSNSNGVTRLQ